MSESQRLDKFLWCARFAKSRSAAARLIADGVVTMSGRAVKPHHAIHVGDKFSLLRGRADLRVTVLALGERRGPAAEARQLYTAETAAPSAAEPWVALIED